MRQTFSSKLLNIGSGTHYARGWVNVDKHVPTADVQCSIYELPFDDDTFARAYLGHVLEHLVYEQIPVALAEVARVCEPGAKVMVVGPDIDRAVALKEPPHILAAIRASDPPDTSGCGHAWTPNLELTMAPVRDAFDWVEQIPINMVRFPDWPNPCPDGMWQIAIVGTVR